MSWGPTHLRSFGPLCWIMWRLRWDLREKRRPQPSTGHGHGRCGHRDIAVRLHTRQPTLQNITPSIFHWMCLLRLRCAPSRAPSASTVCWKWPRSCCGCSWRAAAGGRRRRSCCRARRSSSSSVSSSSSSSSSSNGSATLWGKAAARVCPSYRLLAGLNWLICVQLRAMELIVPLLGSGVTTDFCGTKQVRTCWKMRKTSGKQAWECKPTPKKQDFRFK